MGNGALSIMYLVSAQNNVSGRLIVPISNNESEAEALTPGVSVIWYEEDQIIANFAHTPLFYFFYNI